jgi:hypothetical protein
MKDFRGALHHRLAKCAETYAAGLIIRIKKMP